MLNVPCYDAINAFTAIKVSSCIATAQHSSFLLMTTPIPILVQSAWMVTLLELTLVDSAIRLYQPIFSDQGERLANCKQKIVRTLFQFSELSRFLLCGTSSGSLAQTYKGRVCRRGLDRLSVSPKTQTWDFSSCSQPLRGIRVSSQSPHPCGSKLFEDFSHIHGIITLGIFVPFSGKAARNFHGPSVCGAQGFFVSLCLPMAPGSHNARDSLI